MFVDDFAKLTKNLVWIIAVAAWTTKIGTSANVAFVFLAPINIPVVLVAWFHDLESSIFERTSRS